MRLSLLMMVRNGASTLERAIRPIREHIDEICFVDTGSDDDTIDTLYRLSSDLKVPCKTFLQDPITHPDEYFLDERSSFRLRLSATFPFSKTPLLKDWSKPRNRALHLCAGQYVMKLDVDDQVMDPQDIPSILSFLDRNPQLDLFMSRYETMGGTIPKEVEFSSIYTRIWRNKSSIYFKEPCHENVDHLRKGDGSNWGYLLGGMNVRDWKDSKGVNVPYLYFKTLLFDYEQTIAAGKKPNKHVLLYLADEGALIAPEFTLDILSQIDYSTTTTDDEAWTRLSRGRSLLNMFYPWEDVIKEFSLASSQGRPRAGLLMGLLMHHQQIDGWEKVLQDAIVQCQERCWPFGATRSELRDARLLLTKGR